MKVPAWLVRLLGRDGLNCHLCGLPVDINLGKRLYKLSASRDHVIPNPHTKKGKRTLKDAAHPANQPENIRLAHRFCNSLRGQQAITADLRRHVHESLITKLTRRLGSVAAVDAEMENLRTGYGEWLATPRPEPKPRASAQGMNTYEGWQRQWASGRSQ